MKRRWIFLISVIIVVAVVVLLIAVEINSHPDEVTVVKKVEINREQKEEDLSAQKKESAVDKENANAQEKQPSVDKKYAEGEVLVKFKQGISNEDIKAFLMEYKLKILDVIKGINVFRFKTPAGAPFKEVLDKLNKDSRIEYAEPNYIFKIN